MSKLTKKQKILQEKLDPEKVYSIDEAMEIMQSVKSDKFDESVDISIKLGVDPNKSDQNVRGAVTLPNSLGKDVRVAVFADGDNAKDAESAGAEYVGMEDLAEKFTKEEIEMWIRNGKQKKELYNESIDLMVEMIENPKKDFRSRISKLWI